MTRNDSASSHRPSTAISSDTKRPSTRVIPVPPGRRRCHEPRMNRLRAAPRHRPVRCLPDRFADLICIGSTRSVHKFKYPGGLATVCHLCCHESFTFETIDLFSVCLPHPIRRGARRERQYPTSPATYRCYTIGGLVIVLIAWDRSRW